MQIAELADKTILILGFGSEGQDSFLFLRKKFPEKSIGIADKKQFEELPTETRKLLNADLKVVLYFGDNYLKQLHAYDVVIKSPGIPTYFVQPRLKKHQILTNQTNVFFANCKGTIIGITGTKGKSTTASLIYEILRAAKKKVYLVGNIEQPVLQYLHKATKDDIFVYELSSAQLELATQSPHIAVFLNFYPEHLDFHKTLKAYLEAKANITKFQTAQDYIIFNTQNKEVATVAASSKANKIPYTPKPEKAHLSSRQGNGFVTPLQPVFAVAELFDIPKEKAQATIKKFKPLPHRLQPVGTYQGITFYNDSLATIPEATVAALHLLGKSVHTLIAGGFNRGVPQDKLAAAVVQSNIRTLILLPDTGELLWKEVQKRKPSAKLDHFFASNMQQATQLAFEHTPKGKICLLSPAASSFNMFKNYKDRGDQFQKFLLQYGKEKRA